MRPTRDDVDVSLSSGRVVAARDDALKGKGDSPALGWNLESPVLVQVATGVRRGYSEIEKTLTPETGCVYAWMHIYQYTT